MAFKKRDNRLNGLNPLSYMGVEPVSPPGSFQINRAPTVNDLNYDIGDIWIDSVTLNIYMLVSTAYDRLAGTRVATWVLLSTGVTGITDVITDDLVDVAPVGGVINLRSNGTPYLNTTGAGNTATINFNPNGLVTQFTADDANVVTPVAGNINATGGFSVISTKVPAPGVLEIDLDDGGAGQVIIGSGGGGFGAPVWANLTSSDGSVIITNGPNTIDLKTLAGSGSIVSVYDTPGAYVWTKDPRTVFIIVYGWSGGGGGQSGSQGALGGGGGGAGGGGFIISSPSIFFGANENVVVGAGGTGGAPQVNPNTAGNPGSDGGATSFGYMKYDPVGSGAASIAGGTEQRFYSNYATDAIFVGGTGVNNTVPSSPHGGQAAAGSAGTAAYWNVAGLPQGDVPTFYGAVPGSAGGGGDVGRASGAGSNIRQTSTTLTNAYTSGTILVAGGASALAGAHGGNGTGFLTAGGIVTGGAGASGGGGQSGLSVGNGGLGGFPGGAGAGGGASNNGTPSGAGGNGADGCVIVVEIF